MRTTLIRELCHDGSPSPLELTLFIYLFICCGFFGFFGHVLKVVLPDVLPVSVAGIFKGLE